MAKSATNRSSTRLLATFSIAIVILTLAIYSRVMGFEFVNYDDNKYIQMNPMVLAGVTFDGVRWAFSTFTLANWHPLTWLSHMMDVQLFDLNAGMHHFVNVLIHAANAALLLILLTRMTGSVWRSALVSVLFAIHPLHVESVAWISERKDVLSTLFGLLAMIAYVRWAGVRAGNAPRRSRGITEYLAMVALFAMSLMCKPMLVTLPFLLLLLDFWPLRRAWNWQRIIEKSPLLVLSLASSVITVIAQSKGGAISQLDAVPIWGRIANAVMAYAIYLLQIVWPFNLAPLYPLPPSWSPLAIIVSAGVLIVITVVVCAFISRKPSVLVGWLWYLGTLVPVIGLIQVGSQARADRYTYLPLIGLFIMIAWSIPALPRERRGTIAFRNSTIAAALIACAAITWHQLGFWKDSITLSQRAIAVTSPNAVAHFNLANALVDANRTQDALPHFTEAAMIRPDWADPDNNLGNAYLRLGDATSAIEAWRRALARQPRHPQANKSLGVVLAQQGQLIDAASHLGLAVEISPNDAVARMFYATVLRDLQQSDEAVIQFEQAAALAAAQGDLKLLEEIRRRMNAMPASGP